MNSDDTYHALMLFVKRLQAELKDCDLEDWVLSEVQSIEPMPHQKPKGRKKVEISPRLPELAKQIQAYRMALGFSQTQAANVIGRSLCHLFRLETGSFYKTEKPYLQAINILSRGFNYYQAEAA